MSTYSEELLALNDKAVQAVIPAIVYVAVLMTIGLLGNPLVIYFYGCKQKATPSYIFIVTLAIFDSITCAVSMPLELVDLIRFYTFESSETCKLLRFVNYFASIASGFTLIAIAVDRYRKICRPFERQISLTLSKFIIFLVIICTLICSWPAAVFNQVVEVNVTETPPVVGYDCTTLRDEEYKLYITVYNIFLFLMFAGAITVLIVLYTLVGRKLFSLRSFRFYAEKKKKSKNIKVRPLSSTTNQTDETGIRSLSDSVATATEIPLAFCDLGDNDFHLPTIEENSRPPSVTSNFSRGKVTPFEFGHDSSRLSSPISNNSQNKLRNCQSFTDSVRKEHAISVVMRPNSANIEKLRAHRINVSSSHEAMLSQKENSSSPPSNEELDEQEYKERCASKIQTRDAKGTADIDQRKLHAQNVNTRKYTIVMLSISIAFILSFLPYLGLITWRTLSKDYEPNLFSTSQLVAFQIGLRSFLLSSACNPLIYGFLNTDFKKFILSICCCCCKSVKDEVREPTEQSTSGSKSHSQNY
ncbi:hypothetical protein FSP39_007946 [Pinctada imbricata]|uniref:G-protein coupled receptors family 1 profile domain-containing protein n=1 Tax=Pinctada imbricata TaxID=66713 RepID=A0AA88XLL0_PINIB|nr:hypothetical protein FSP39_007946 [Pinctada imbricata]